MLAMRTEDSPVLLKKELPPSYRVRDRELPQRLLGALLWIAFFVILWMFGGHG